MYLKFFGLTDKPFELTPDPRFLFLTPGHREALAQLIYGIQEQKGFILMTGEVGTGKTTLLRTAMQRMEGQADFAFVTNSTLPFDQLLQYALADFGVKDPRGTRAERLIALNHFLIEQRRAGRKTVLIIDEAQNLSAQTLEQIRLLSNFETTSDKLLQIILSGQPELYARVHLPELRQLRQRIALRCKLSPMTDAEMEQYITGHLRVAGARYQPFSEAAVRVISRYSRGVPRLLNLACDHCMVAAYANQSREIDGEIAKSAIRYLEDGERAAPMAARLRIMQRPRNRSRRAVVAWSAGAVAAVAATAGVVLISAYQTASNAMSGTVGGSLGGLVRWLTHWWGP
jgi:general secretion pathway protein A